jgi:hypothetical protein
LGNVGELLAVGHGGAAAITLPSGGSPFSSLIPSNRDRPNPNPTAEKEGYPFGVYFAKETPSYLLLNLPSLANS